MIDGVKISELSKFIDNRGAVLKYLRCDSSSFNSFGEAYFSIINAGITKGWKFHKLANQNFTVPFGKVKFILYDDREHSKTRGEFQEIILDNLENYKLLSVPSKIWYSFKCISKDFSILANITDILHDPDESINLDLSTKEIPYDWQ